MSSQKWVVQGVRIPKGTRTGGKLGLGWVGLVFWVGGVVVLRLDASEAAAETTEVV